jgi:iron complex transport system substrate-binding protein
MRPVFLAGLFLFYWRKSKTMAFESILGAPNGVNAEFRRRRLVGFCAGIAVLFLILCDGAFPAQTSGTHGTLPAGRELTDEVGRRIRIPLEVDRVVSLAPNLTEIVFALGDGNHLAGDTDFCDYPPEARHKPHVGGPVNPNLEVIVSLMPDLVLATSMNRRETVNALDHIGMPVYYVTLPHSVEEMIASVEHLGGALGAEKSAAMLAGDLRGRLADLDRRLAGSAPRRVLFVVWTDPLISVGRDTFIADALRRAGGRSVVETSAEWPRMSLEEIVRLQPEVLVFASAHTGSTQRDIDSLRARPGWRELDAIQRGNIVVISDAINRPAPRMVDAIEHLARALHPEAFTLGTAPSVGGGTGFSLWGFESAGTKPHSLPFRNAQGKKPVPPSSNPIISNPRIEEACACAR